MRYVLAFGALLFVANAVLGIVTLNQSKAAMSELINKDMLDVVNSAAKSLDGDALGALTEDDVDGPAFREIEKRLLVYQDSVDIHYIYAVKQVGENEFVFTVDPDPVDPGAFGEEFLVTPGLLEAAKGTPAVDGEPAEDRWGNFYSAYSPVLDSSGKVAGIVGIDFDAEWYDEQIRKYTISTVIVTVLSVLLGAVIVVLITNRIRLRFQELNEGLEGLSKDMDVLMDEVASYSSENALPSTADAETVTAKDSGDELEVLSAKIHTMQTEMRTYLAYLQKQAHTDSLTQVGNATAYHEAIQEIDQQIADGTAVFSVAIYDINGLKELNDQLGHECGDYYIQGAAHALEQGFADARVYRIGGDEFAVIASGVRAEEMEKGFAKVEAAVAEFNASSAYPATLVASRGIAEFVPGQDASYKEVFSRADSIMYENKRAYYRANENNRRNGR